mmetsp:Transcript_61353/g.142795  ORF Transcript_61353/g.142795 Transcript_61353/m.142795 type:complete len:111 (+) Transcript_61353:63-395(+)
MPASLVPKYGQDFGDVRSQLQGDTVPHQVTVLIDGEMEVVEINPELGPRVRTQTMSDVLKQTPIVCAARPGSGGLVGMSKSFPEMTISEQECLCIIAAKKNRALRLWQQS